MTTRIRQPDTIADEQLRHCLSSEALTSFVMVAGAGSGKTTSLVKALAHLEKQRGTTLRRRGQKIACITYTEVAVHEIWGDVGNDPLFHVSTIHSFLWNLVRPFQTDLKAWVHRRLEQKLDELKSKELDFGKKTQEKTRVKNAEDQDKCRRQLASLHKVERFTYGTGSDYLAGVLGHDDILKVGPDLIGRHRLLQLLVAQRYPYVFVDESQDTSLDVINAFKTVDRQVGDRFCLGFFGDPMQKIYATGAGGISSEDTWETISKPENFRCPTRVLNVINNIRKDGDGWAQTRGRMMKVGDDQLSVEGSAIFFICPADSQRTLWLDRARHWMAELNEDPGWLSNTPEADVRILVIVHRMAARRLGFEQLYAAFNDDAPSAFKEGFFDGTVWAVQPFLAILLPLVRAIETGNTFEVMNLLRKHCPLLQKEHVRNANTAATLRKIKTDIVTLANMMTPGSGSTVADVLSFVRGMGLLTLDERFDIHLAQATALGTSAMSNVREDEQTAMAAYLACPAGQLQGYRAYIETESPFSTQQGIKGAEFERVLTVLDDEESNHNMFSYGKLLGLTPLSATDQQNQRDGKESVVDRTRKLFYVCCSRATKDLAVVLFTPDVDFAEETIRTAGLFPEDSIVALST